MKGIDIKVIIAQLKEIWRQRPLLIWIGVVILSGLLAFFRDHISDTTASLATSRSEPENADTFIPKGFVLVPIEVVNFESLDSVLGRFGIVDLFAANPSAGAKARLIASRIRILRAPRNPNHFAVLAPIDRSASLVRHEGGYFVVVRNPNSTVTHFEDETPPKVPQSQTRSRIHVEMPNDPK